MIRLQTANYLNHNYVIFTSDQILVNECLVYVTYYDVVVKITNDSSCPPGTLFLTTALAVSILFFPFTFKDISHCFSFHNLKVI